MNRGWRNEGWRHSLAARGIPTGNRYMAKRAIPTAGRIRIGVRMPKPYSGGTDGGYSILKAARKKRDEDREKNIRDLNIVEELNPEELTKDERIEMVKRRRGDFYSIGDPEEWKEIAKEAKEFEKSKDFEMLKKEFPHKSNEDLKKISEGRERTKADSEKFHDDLRKRLRVEYGEDQK